MLGEEAEVVDTFKGTELEGLTYSPLFTEAYEAEGEGKPVYAAGLDTYVSDSDGTGIVHTAPSFGEDDMRLTRNSGWPVILGVDSEGKHRFGAEANNTALQDLVYPLQLYGPFAES